MTGIKISKTTRSFPRKRESPLCCFVHEIEIPAFAGMTPSIGERGAERRMRGWKEPLNLSSRHHPSPPLPVKGRVKRAGATGDTLPLAGRDGEGVGGKLRVRPSTTSSIRENTPGPTAARQRKMSKSRKLGNAATPLLLVVLLGLLSIALWFFRKVPVVAALHPAYVIFIANLAIAAFAFITYRSQRYLWALYALLTVLLLVFFGFSDFISAAFVLATAFVF